MSEKKARIHSLAFRTKCEAYGCKNTSYGGYNMYAIGIPNHLSHKPVFCGECVQTMMSNLPEELRAIVGASVDLALGEATADKDLQIANKDLRIAELEALVATLMPPPDLQVKVDLTPENDADKEPEPEQDPEPAKEPEPDHPEGTLLRCLDCGEEFARKTEFTKHRNKVHPEV